MVDLLKRNVLLPFVSRGEQVGRNTRKNPGGVVHILSNFGLVHPIQMAKRQLKCAVQALISQYSRILFQFLSVVGHN